jgi:hypothetical protein
MAKDDRPVSNNPKMTEDDWQGLAIATAVASLLAGVAGSVWILGLTAPDGIEPSIMAERGRALAPIGTFLIAIVTFCTVAWRAKVTERQANAQERQLESADENNLAILLQKGAELLSDEDEGKVAAGIACLEAVVTAKNRRFGTQAMNLLAKYIERKHNNSLSHYLCQSAMFALRSGADNSNFSDIRIDLRTSNKSTEWFKILGVKEVSYSGGTFGEEYWATKIDTSNGIFYDVNFVNCIMSIGFPNFRDCNFTICSFDKVDVDSFGDNSFYECDFTKTIFNIGYDMFKIGEFSNSGGNYFSKNNPPILKKGAEQQPFDPASIFDTSA